MIFMGVVLKGMVYGVSDNGEGGLEIKVEMWGRVEFELER